MIHQLILFIFILFLFNFFFFFFNNIILYRYISIIYFIYNENLHLLPKYINSHQFVLTPFH